MGQYNGIFFFFKFFYFGKKVKRRINVFVSKTFHFYFFEDIHSTNQLIITLFIYINKTIVIKVLVMFKSSVTIYLKSCFSILTNNYKQLFIFYFTDFKISVTNKF